MHNFLASSSKFHVHLESINILSLLFFFMGFFYLSSSGLVGMLLAHVAKTVFITGIQSFLHIWYLADYLNCYCCLGSYRLLAFILIE